MDDYFDFDYSNEIERSKVNYTKEKAKGAASAFFHLIYFISTK